MTTMIPRNKVIAEAARKIRVLRGRALESNLEAFCSDLGEAYRQGVEEAQSEIVARLTAMRVYSVSETGAKHD